MSEFEGHTYKREHQLSGQSLKLDIVSETDRQLELARGSSTGRAAMTLAKEGPLRLTLLALKQGTVIADHKAPGPVSIHMLTGEATISVGDAVEHLDAGQALVLDANVAHSVTAIKDAAILLTIAVT